MNRIQFFVLTGLSSLFVLLLVGHVILTRQTNWEQNRLAATQQFLTQAQGFQNNLKQLALRIYSDGQKTNDQGLKDLLTRQQITYTPGPAAETAPAPAPAPAPAH